MMKIYQIQQKNNQQNIKTMIGQYGHSHMLSYTVQDGMTILVSGAGAKSYLDQCKSANPLWSKGGILGFMSLELSEDYMQITAHYAQDDGEEQWQKLVFPSTQRKLKNNEW
ncbi:hypothetical protein PPERSA_12092 [Pseudocohnilembus persalinus]|uniref:Uncharacterized protein n=1 Tax=Pseudocohnilembus persalinus TaxID=266149 RepID=A0A0V0R9S5_PSEPJ|nr:hypothetical protein PPERSA_12092 [Pseudocohnilembus persalinus]|eukprot:KRX10968.1 hypothetical protein PPERSA_12092 [Pseudocohnilembus persalinus]